MQTATYARIHAVLTLTRKTEPLDLDGALALTTGKLVSNYSSRKEDLKSVQALVGAGVYSGDYKNTDFIGLQSSAGTIVILGIGSLNGQEDDTTTSLLTSVEQNSKNLKPNTRSINV